MAGNQDFSELLQKLNAHEVEFLIVGGASLGSATKQAPTTGAVAELDEGHIKAHATHHAEINEFESDPELENTPSL